jgi:glycerophosphoryl diester phosphodiesterase
MALSPAGVTAMRLGGRTLRYGEGMANRLARAGVGCAQVPAWTATAPLVRRAHALGLQVHVWTLNQRHEMERALDVGADGIMTDETVMLRDVLAERGQWPHRPRMTGEPGAAG